jgi:hypothetical protein
LGFAGKGLPFLFTTTAAIAISSEIHTKSYKMFLAYYKTHKQKASTTKVIIIIIIVIMNIISSVFIITFWATLQGTLLMSQGQTLSLRLITE